MSLVSGRPLLLSPCAVRVGPGGIRNADPSPGQCAASWPLSATVLPPALIMRLLLHPTKRARNSDEKPLTAGGLAGAAFIASAIKQRKL